MCKQLKFERKVEEMVRQECRLYSRRIVYYNSEGKTLKQKKKHSDTLKSLSCVKHNEEKTGL